MAESDWREVVALAERLSKVVDFDEHERDYKVEISERMRAVRSSVESDDPEWPQALVRALRGNLIHFTTIMKVSEVVQSDREGARSALLNLWNQTDKTAAQVAWHQYLNGRDPKIYIGAALTTGSVLLFADESREFAPYRSEVVKKFARLVGEEPADDYSVADRWDQFVRLMDELGMRLRAAGLQVRDRLDAQGYFWALMHYGAKSVPDRALALDLDEWRTGVVGGGTASVKRRNHQQPIVEDGGWRVLLAGLKSEPSPLSQTPSAWTQETAAELGRRCSDEDLAGAGTYMEKLHRQLDGAPAPVYRLAADFIYLNLLPLVNVRGDTKLERVEQIRDWSGEAWEIPEELRSAAEAGGAFNGGQGYSAQRWRHMLWFCEFVGKWDTLTESARTSALTNPWEFARVLEGLDPDIPAMRYVFAYYAWPNVFMDIVSPDHRRKIRDAFADEIGGASGDSDIAISRDIYDIREVLEDRSGSLMSFYQSPYGEQWQNDKTRRAWFVNLAADREATWDRWVEEQEVSLLAPEVTPEIAGASLDTVTHLVGGAHLDMDADARDRRAREVFAFVSRAKSGDLFVTAVDGSLHVGESLGALAPQTDSAGELAIQVAWFPGLIELDAAPPQVQAALESPGVVIELTTVIAAIDSLIDPGDEPGKEPIDGEMFAPLTPEFCGDIHMPMSEVQRFVDALKTRKQMVFYGPPGTGKTYLARRLARHLSGGKRTDAMSLVQFHPSYAYEDFFEGYRPSVTDGGQASFKLTKGPLRLLADEASKPENLSRPYFLIVDEMNRGNLAKVFGELYFLLEYRDQAVALQYSPEKRFALPPNVFIIGTMNTTDRSVGLVDAAIRRRFPFIELHPDSSPVEGVLSAFLKKKGFPDERARLLKALNLSIDVRDLRVGPSYFMRDEAATETGLAQIWDYDILPLLVEHFYGSKDAAVVTAEFGLDAIRELIDASYPVAEAVASTGENPGEDELA
ncbi:AAA family ATPase [Demequina sp.]|uniref:McrB family protein n=1 Tax=Demequina sp. TaxID=2050685 RepID=UPI0025C3C4C2|nr:AAA family ATPase [Demequina sp.]